jgi:hypothetical protein
MLFLLCLTEYRRNAWILEYKKLAREKSVWGGQPKPSLPALTPRKSSSRDPAAMEETCAESTPSHSVQC